MERTRQSLERLTEEEKAILYRFLAFADAFSVDWFVGRENMLPSRLFSVVTFLVQRHWIRKHGSAEGHYEWTATAPRQEILKLVPAEQMSQYYREAIDTYAKHRPHGDDEVVKIANLCMLAGIEDKDVDVIYQAACIEENRHKISSAIGLYDQLLDFVEKLLDRAPEDKSGNLRAMFIRTVERRASLSPFYPNLKKLYSSLCRALEIADGTGDKNSQTSIHLLMGQNYWMSFQYGEAEKHFDRAWQLIRKTKNNSLFRMGLQSQGLSFWMRGNFSRAIRYYERSIGMIDSPAADDFSMLASLQLALCYTQVGMPQRGLGLSESVYRHAEKTSNHPLAAFALSTTGLILLEMKEYKNSHVYFSMALDISKKEAIPMAEIISALGLANIECIQGNDDTAAQLFRIIYKIRKSSWYHTFNITPAFETGLMLYQKGFHFAELAPVIDYVGKITKEQVNPLLYGIIRRLQIQFQAQNDPAALKERIANLIELENHVRQVGETFELAKIRIEIARLNLRLNQWPEAEKYGRKAWAFLKPIARSAYPSDLMRVIPDEELSGENHLFDAVIEMGEALGTQKAVAPLLTGIVTFLSRLTGAERAALFVPDRDTQDLRMVASRNLAQDQLSDPQFKIPMDMMRSKIAGGDGKIAHFKTEHKSRIGFHDVIIAPLQLDRKIVGVLYQESRFFSFNTGSSDMRLLSALVPQIAVAMDRAQAHQEIARLNDELNRRNRSHQEEKADAAPLHGIVGRHPSMLKLYQVIRKFAPTPLTVTIYGETGVGKELVARAIHLESTRSKGPFVRVNCAALSESLIESELFGHDKGAFTGAIKTKAGRFELAHNGTIFLDEISEMPLQTQSKLLRVIQEKEFQRVGGTETLYSDFRLIAATNKDLKQEMNRGNFRSDLFYRLNVAPVTLIPLRERSSDIPLLATHFARLYCQKYDKVFEGISEHEMEKFMSYPWPGNVRELSNMIEQSILLHGPGITFPEIQSADPVVNAGDMTHQRLEDVERTHIIGILKCTNGKISGKNSASSLLGLKRSTLIHRMKKLGISIDRVLKADS
ncbi:MAG: sigma 54-interacting transcriptional regulator [Syntrophaceae bacterium]|nr:sigma 54-interacting transcriptional regulator [Syntrophaceae bacterium]